MAMRIGQVGHGTDRWRETVRLRDVVLRAPLGLAFTDDELAAEASQLHLALHVDDALAAVVVLVPSVGKLRQMAVVERFRGLRLGTALVGAAEREMRARDVERVVLHARMAAASFYARLGYVAEGAEFMEVTIPHLLMSKRLG